MENDDSTLRYTVTKMGRSRGRPGEGGIVWPARHLSKNIGPRPPGSQAERSASHYFAKELKALGFAPEAQRFKTPSTTAWSEFFVHLITIVGVLTFPVFTHLSFILVLLGFFLFLLEQYGRSPFSWLQRHHPSENIICKINPLRDRHRVVVIAAHIDSPRSAFYYRPGIVNFFRISFLLDFFCHAGLFMLFTFAYGGYLLNMDQDILNFLWLIGLALTLIPFLSMIALFCKATLGKATPGGNDNASGVAVLLELARLFSHRLPIHTEVWLVSTGASDAGCLGIRRLMRENRSQLRGAYFIILDQVGRGFPVCYRREGRLIPFRPNRILLSAAKDVSKNQTPYHAGFIRNNLYISEGFQLLSRGKKALTVSSRDKSRYPLYWRWEKDGYQNVDPRSLRLTFDFIRALIDNLDRRGKKK